MNTTKFQSTAKGSPKNGASDLTHIVLIYDDNRLVRDLFGQFDENIALVERELGVDAVARGNELDVRGTLYATSLARIVFDNLYTRLQQGNDLVAADVEGAIRMAQTANLSSIDTKTDMKSRLSLASISTIKKVIHARSATQDAYIRAMERAELVFGCRPRRYWQNLFGRGLCSFAA